MAWTGTYCVAPGGGAVTPPASPSARTTAGARLSPPWVAATAGVGAAAAVCWLVIYLSLAGPGGSDGGAICPLSPYEG